MNTFQQWEFFHLNHQERLREAELMRLSRQCRTNPSLLSKLMISLRQRLASRPRVQRTLELAQPK